MGRVSRSRSRAWALATTAAAALVTAAPAVAQRMPQPDTYSRFSGSLSLLHTQPMGNLEVGPGWGIDVSAALGLDPARVFRLRANLRANFYGRDSRNNLCLSETVGCLIQVDLHTDYTSFFFGVGPEVAIPLGGATLALDAAAGVGSFTVSSSVQGASDPDNEDLFRTNNFDDTFFAWSAGSELRMHLSPQFSLALGAHYLHNGEASYVKEGGVTQNTDGSVNIDAITTDANQMAFTLGVAFHPFQGWTDKMGDDDG